MPPDSNNITANMSAGIPNAQLKVYYDTLAFEWVVGVVVPTIFAVVVITGLFGNMLVVLVVLKNQQMQNSTNTLILR